MKRRPYNKRTIPFRRKREQKTDYKKRMHLLLSRKPRLVIRKSLKHMQAQLVSFDVKGDKILVAAHSSELKSKGYSGFTSNTSAAYLTGLLLAKKAKDKKIGSAIADMGLYPKNLKSKLFAVIKGAREGGLEVPADEAALPDDKRVTGEHIALYAKTLKADDKKRYDVQFSRYIKNKADPEQIPAMVQAAKTKING